jgi:hypothetical protein
MGAALLLVAALLMFIWATPSGSALAWGVTAVLGASGIAALVEARLGWCAARAAGLRVPF